MKLQMGNKEVEFKQVTFAPTDGEPWVDYKLEDGNVLRVKLVVSDVLKALTEKDGFGRPVYQISHSTVFSVITKEEAVAARTH